VQAKWLIPYKETHPRVSGDDELPNARIASYLAEDNGPLHLCRINATYSQREATRRAVAEIDGMFAGLKYLDKMQKSTIDPLVDDDFGPPSSFDEDWSWPGPEDLFPSDTEHPLFIRELALFGQDAADSIRPDGAGTDPEQPVPPTQPAIDKEKAWEGLLVLRISMRGEFRHFQQAVSKSTSVPLHDLKLCFASSTSLIDRGILVCRDVLAGMVPGTLSEIFAFACLSHAISRILVRRKRMLPNQVLLGLPRWRDCIFDSQEREAFDTLASEMWPSSFCSPAKGDGSDLPGYPVGGATLNTNVPEIQDDASQFLQWPARVISDEMRYGFQPDRDVLPWTTLTGSEFGFHRLQVLEEGTDSHRYAVPQGIDPRDPRFCEPELSIPGYSFCRYSPPIGSAYLSPNIGIASSIPDAPPSSRGLYNFQIDERVSECTAFNLRNTVGFLAVSAFITETGEKFYRLSASGMTVTQGGTGSAFAERRSKAERKLRSEFLGPLKRAGAKDVRFLALLSVAKAFVVLGHLRTEEEVQKYMLQVSEVTISLDYDPSRPGC